MISGWPSRCASSASSAATMMLVPMASSSATVTAPPRRTDGSTCRIALPDRDWNHRTHGSSVRGAATPVWAGVSGRRAIRRLSGGAGTRRGAKRGAAGRAGAALGARATDVRWTVVAHGEPVVLTATSGERFDGEPPTSTDVSDRMRNAPGRSGSAESSPRHREPIDAAKSTGPQADRRSSRSQTSRPRSADVQFAPGDAPSPGGGGQAIRARWLGIARPHGACQRHRYCAMATDSLRRNQW